MEFRILGPLEIRQNGRSLPCKGAKQRLLLATLLLHPNEVVSSDRLIDALWGEDPPPTAAKALQVHVSQLRRLLEPGLLVTRPPGYELRVGDGQLDLPAFEAQAAEGRAAAASGRAERASALLGDALALWRGPPLADLTFEEALRAEISRLEELRLAVLEDRIGADLALGRHSELVPELEGLAGAHPLRERLRWQLMVALYRSGRQADALEVYRQTRRLLVDELGLEPSRELKALEERILAQDPELDSPRAPAPPAAAEGLIGRDRELGELLPIVDAAVAGHGAVILIAGEPGIGKSRLAESLARHAARSGAQVGVGRCWEAGGAPPFWPWAQALRGVGDELGDLLREQSAPADDDPGARFRMFASLTDSLGSAAATTPLALFLDDIHAADAPSLLLLRFLASQLAGTPIVIVGCFRDTETGDDLAQTLAELARDPVVHRIGLTGLDAEATSGLLTAAMGAAAPDALAARVHAETHGNPLFAGEIGRLLVAEGRADAAGERLPIPDGVREAIRRRLQRQSPECRDLLVLASVLGREFELAPVSYVSGLDEDALLAALEEATSARLVGAVPGAGERLRFSHILVRDVLYDDLSPPRRLRLHRAAGEALEHLHEGSLDARITELAHHFVAAGRLGSDKAPAYAERAGDVAATQFGYEEAARHYGLALDLLERGGAADPQHVCDLLLSLGDVYSRAGNTAAAKGALRRAASIADEHAWNDRLVRAALGYGGRFAWTRASTDPALVPMLERALEVVEPGSARSRARLLARLGAAIRDEPTRERREAIVAEAVEIGRRSGDAVALAYALEGYGVAAEGLHPAEEDLPNADELIALGIRLGDLERVFTGRDLRMNALWKLGDRAGVEVEIDALTALADELRQPAQRWSAATGPTVMALMEGRFAEAEELIQQARAVGERVASWNARVSELLQLFVLRRAQGRLAELEGAIRRSVHEYPTLLRFNCALAHLHAEVGDLTAARAVLDDLASHDLGHEYVDAEWLFTACLLPDPYRALGDQAAADRLYAILLPREHLYAQAPIEATFGSVARALGVLAATLGRLDDADRHLRVAIETERRMGARPWLAYAQHDLAATCLALGDHERAGSLLDEALAGYRALGMDSWVERASALRPG